jgi:hypothetical protein
MTEQEAWNDPEMKVILLLSGYARELGEGKDFETTTYKTAEEIVKLFSIPDVVWRSEQFNCFLEDSEQGLRCDFKCKDCKDYKGVSN